MMDKENVDVIDDITEYTGKYFKEIERLLRELEKDAVLQKTDLTKDWVNDLIKETFNEEDPPIYARLIKKYERLIKLRKNEYVLNAKGNFPDGKFKPYIELYLKVSENHSLKLLDLDFIIILYKELKLPEFKEILIQQGKYDHTKKTRNEKHIKKLFNYKNKLLVIRLALRYKEGYLLPECWYDTQNNGEYNKYLKQKSEHVKNDLKLLINLLKVIYKNDLTGYMWKLRYDPQKQFYYQLMIFLDGDRYTKDVAIAKEICGLWKDTVTVGNGECTNFNAYKKLHTNLSLGIKYKDERELVIQEAKIFIEHDYFVNSMLSGKKQRTFSKGHIPKSDEPSKIKETSGTQYLKKALNLDR
jgi:hypothetical protein